MLAGAACDSRMTMIGEDGKDEDKEEWEVEGGRKQRGRYGDPAAVNQCGKKGREGRGARGEEEEEEGLRKSRTICFSL